MILQGGQALRRLIVKAPVLARNGSPNLEMFVPGCMS